MISVQFLLLAGYELYMFKAPCAFDSISTCAYERTKTLQSKNFFAALDDEDDEPVVKAPVPKAPPKASQSQTDAAKDKR